MPNYLLLEDGLYLLLEDGSKLLTEEPGSYTRSAAISGLGVINSTGFKTVSRTATIDGTGTINATGEGSTPPPAPTTITALTGVGSHRLWQRSRSITLS